MTLQVSIAGRKTEGRLQHSATLATEAGRGPLKSVTVTTTAILIAARFWFTTTPCPTRTAPQLSPTSTRNFPATEVTFPLRQMRATAIQGVLGVSATTAATTVSALPTIEIWLRILSLIVGIAVGIVTFISIVRKMRQ